MGAYLIPLQFFVTETGSNNCPEKRLKSVTESLGDESCLPSPLTPENNFYSQSDFFPSQVVSGFHGESKKRKK
jgi:hypothetical protein